MVDEGNQSADIVYELLSSKSSDKSSDGIIKGLENYVTEWTLGDKKNNFRWVLCNEPRFE